MARSRVGKRTRQWLVFVHVAVSVGWMGAGAANVVLAMTAATTGELAFACYRLIAQIDTWLVIPLAFATLVSGVVVSVASPWGLTRYWWVLSKLVLTVVVILASTFGIGAWVEESIAVLDAGAATSPVAAPLAAGAFGNIAAFLFMTWASVAKPWGTTPWGKRSGRTLRARAQPAGST